MNTRILSKSADVWPPKTSSAYPTIGPASVAFIATPVEEDVVNGSPTAIITFSTDTFVGTRPERSTEKLPLVFWPATNPGRVETTPAMRVSLFFVDFTSSSFSVPNTTTSPGSSASFDGNISAKSYDPVAHPAAFVRIYPSFLPDES